MDDHEERDEVEEVTGDPTAGLDLTVEAVVDAPDIRIAHKPEDFHEGPLAVAVEVQEDGNVIVTIKADCRIRIDEVGGDDGPVFRSVTFKGAKTNLRDAVSLAVRNEVHRAASDEMRRIMPTGKQRTEQALSLRDDNRRLRTELEQRQARLRELLGEDADELFASTGFTTPKVLRDQPVAASRGSKDTAGR